MMIRPPMTKHLENHTLHKGRHAQALNPTYICSSPLAAQHTSRGSRPHALWVVEHVFRINCPFDLFQLAQIGAPVSLLAVWELGIHISWIASKSRVRHLGSYGLVDACDEAPRSLVHFTDVNAEALHVEQNVAVGVGRSIGRYIIVTPPCNSKLTNHNNVPLSAVSR